MPSHWVLRISLRDCVTSSAFREAPVFNCWTRSLICFLPFRTYKLPIFFLLLCHPAFPSTFHPLSPRQGPLQVWFLVLSHLWIWRIKLSIWNIKINDYGFLTFSESYRLVSPTHLQILKVHSFVETALISVSGYYDIWSQRACLCFSFFTGGTVDIDSQIVLLCIPST